MEMQTGCHRERNGDYDDQHNHSFIQLEASGGKWSLRWLSEIRMVFGVTELVPVTCPVFCNSSGFYLYQNYPGRFHTMMCMSGLVYSSTASMKKIKPSSYSGSLLFCSSLPLEPNSHGFVSFPPNRVSSCGAAQAWLVCWEALMLSEVISVPIQNFLCFS